MPSPKGAVGGKLPLKLKGQGSWGRKDPHPLGRCSSAAREGATGPVIRDMANAQDAKPSDTTECRAALTLGGLRHYVVYSF